MIEEQISQQQIPLKEDKTKKYILLAGIIIILITSMFFIWNKGKVYGGNLACENTDMVLVEGFKCKDINKEKTTNLLNNQDNDLNRTQKVE